MKYSQLKGLCYKEFYCTGRRFLLGFPKNVRPNFFNILKSKLGKQHSCVDMTFAGDMKLHYTSVKRNVAIFYRNR